MEDVRIQTPDGVLLIGTYAHPAQTDKAVLLLHMMPADRKSWDDVQAELERVGIASLAIDLRGHGESLKQGTRDIDYRTFSDTEHQGSRIDVAASLEWLRHRGYAKLGIMGASIGANLAIEASVVHPDITAVALLSPGERYRGIESFGPASGMRPDQPLLAMASEGDDQESFDAAKKIVELSASKDKTFLPFVSAGHGTNLLLQEKTLGAALADWFSKRLA